MERQVIHASPSVVRFMLPVIRPVSATAVEDVVPLGLTFDREVCSIDLHQPVTVHQCADHDVVIYRRAGQAERG